jgi:hypothetical protein
MIAPAPARRLAALALCLALTACVPLYLPPVPGDALVPEPRLRTGGDSMLEVVRQDDRTALLFRLELVEVPTAGWLAVQWFGPAGAARASESVWIAPADAGSAIALRSPPELAVTAGEWRALVSWYGTIVRQVRVVVASDGDGNGDGD